VKSVPCQRTIGVEAASVTAKQATKQRKRITDMDSPAMSKQEYWGSGPTNRACPAYRRQCRNSCSTLRTNFMFARRPGFAPFDLLRPAKGTSVAVSVCARGRLPSNYSPHNIDVSASTRTFSLGSQRLPMLHFRIFSTYAI
jgi:hypothetical protein